MRFNRFQISLRFFLFIFFSVLILFCCLCEFQLQMFELTYCLHTDKWWWGFFISLCVLSEEEEKTKSEEVFRKCTIHTTLKRTSFVQNNISINNNSTLVPLMLIWKVYFRKCFSTEHIQFSLLKNQRAGLKFISYPYIATMFIFFSHWISNSMAIIFPFLYFFIRQSISFKWRINFTIAIKIQINGRKTNIWINPIAFASNLTNSVTVFNGLQNKKKKMESKWRSDRRSDVLVLCGWSQTIQQHHELHPFYRN